MAVPAKAGGSQAPRPTTKEKGKGKEKRKRPAPVDQADDRNGDGDDIVNTTKRQFTRNTRKKPGDPVSPQAEPHPLPAGLAFVPLPPTLLDYQDLIPDGILQALESFVPTPIARRLRKRAPSNTPIDSTDSGVPTILRLQKELAEAQTAIIERDTAMDEMMEAPQMINKEPRLWVRHCKTLVEVLQLVEMERDNFKAGEGMAKELGNVIKVKLEDTGSEVTALSEMAAELAESKNQLVIAERQKDDCESRLDDTEARLAVEKQKLTNTECLLSSSAEQLAESKNQLVIAKRQRDGYEACLDDTEARLAVEKQNLAKTECLLSSNAAQSAEIENRLVIAEGQRDDYKARLEESEAHNARANTLPFPHVSTPSSDADSRLADTDHSGAVPGQINLLNNNLHPQLNIAIAERDWDQQNLVQIKESLRDVARAVDHLSTQKIDLEIQLKTVTNDRDSSLRNIARDQTALSNSDDQPPKSDEALRAEIVMANRALQGSQSDDETSHRCYVTKLDGMIHYIKYHHAVDVSQPSGCKSKLPTADRGLLPAQGCPEELCNSSSLYLLDWTGNIMLESQEAEYSERSGKHIMYELRNRELDREREIGNDEGAEGEIACFREKLGLEVTGCMGMMNHWGWEEGGVPVIPSRLDRLALPATWARMDQWCDEGAIGCPTSLRDFGFIFSTLHGKWPEVILAIYSWSFYKIHDTTWDDTTKSNQSGSWVPFSSTGGNVESYGRIISTTNYASKSTIRPKQCPRGLSTGMFHITLSSRNGVSVVTIGTSL